MLHSVAAMLQAEGLSDKLSTWLARNENAVGPGDIHDVYDIDETALLGFGAYGRVLKGTFKGSGRPFAIKHISKVTGPEKAAQKESLKQEIGSMQKLRHPNIVKFVDHFEDKLTHYLVMELCCGGKLIDYVARMQDFRETDASLLMGQVLSALQHLHGQEIVHRDVKPDNMLLESWSPIRDNSLKLVDFGLATRCTPGQEIRLPCGTPEFISPQAVDMRYDTQTDMWSCGASMYMLLCGYGPFQAQTDRGIFAAVKRGNFTFPASDWSSISDDAKDMIRMMLKMNPRDRYTAEAALNDVWIRQRAPGADANVSLRSAVRYFRTHSAQRKHPEPVPNALANVQAVLTEVTNWLIPQADAKPKSYQWY